MQVHESAESTELRAALRDGCERAWTAIYERYTPKLITYALATCQYRWRYDVEAIVAAVWLSTWNRRDKLDDNILLPHRFHGYLQLGVLNHIRTQSRKDAFRQELPMASYRKLMQDSEGDEEDFTTLIEIIGGRIESAPNPAELFERAETVAEVREILHEMATDPWHGNETRGQVLMLAHGNGLSYEEAAEKLGISFCGVKTKIFRARRSFTRKWNEKHGGLA
jgi:RNA polymerase sigma factor (sigma-70 family)